MLDGIRLDSFAAENSLQARHDRSRIRDVAALVEAADTDSFAVALVNARSAEAKEHGSVVLMAWVRAINHAQAGPALAEAPDPRPEAATWLCTYEYTTLALLDANPRSLICVSKSWYPYCGRKTVSTRVTFDALAEGVASGSYDCCCDAPDKLIGIGRPKLRNAVEAHAWILFDLKSRRRALMAVTREGRCLVTPAQLGHPPPAAVVINVDAGLRFGGGDHPLSYLCLRALDWLVRFCQFRRILDVGVSSGALSIAVLKTWPATWSFCRSSEFITNAMPRSALPCAKYSGRAAARLW